MINNRQQQPGRRRGRGGNNGGGGGPRQGNPGRADNGNRIDSRARGNASQLYEKYKSMASDAQRQGDRVNTEYYLQFADHYFRVLSEQRGRFDEQQPRRNDLDFDGDGEFGSGEFGDEGEPMRGGEQAGDGQRFDQDRGDRQRDDRPRAEMRGEMRPEARDERPRERELSGREQNGRDQAPRVEREQASRGEREQNSREQNGRGDRDGYRRDGNGDARAERPRGDWQERQPRADARPEPRPESRAEPRADRRPEQPPVEVAGQRRADPMGPGDTLEQRAEEVLEADRPLDAPVARRRGRPRRDAVSVATTEIVDQMANGVSDDAGDGANGLEADRLPPSLTIAANDEAPAEPKPRRRRARPAEDTPTAAE